MACEPKHELPEWPWADPAEPETPVDPEQPSEPEEPSYNDGLSSWTDLTSNYEGLPEYITVYKSPETLQGKNAIAYVAIADMAEGGKFEVLGNLEYCDDSAISNYGAQSANTPSQFYDACKAPVIINAGLFFWAEKSDGGSFGVSQNLVVREGELLAVNQNYWVEDWNNPVYYYPTVGVFLQNDKGVCSTTWTYTTWDKKTYCYPQPADNSLDKNPLATPSATFPEGAQLIGELNIENAIGGIGVLIHEGEVVNTWKQEMMNVSADSNQPRTAIGSTADNKLIFFVCEGREVTEGVKGLTTGDVAKVLKDLGCTEALNLDGGGSSCMLINGKETIKPSGGSQRAVLTGLRMY